MKKVLVLMVFLVGIMVSLLFDSEFSSIFGSKETTITTTTTNTMPIKVEILNLINKFGKPRYEDLLWEEGDTTIIWGEARMMLAERDSEINFIFIDGGTRLLVEFVLDPSTSFQVKVWNVMITYMSVENQIYLELDYYHYNKLLIPDFEAENINKPFLTWLQDLQALTIRDWEWIITELGYPVYNVSDDEL